MANTKPVDKTNKKNIYCDHCSHYLCDRDHPNNSKCGNPDSKHYNKQRHYYHRCNKFTWK